MILVALAVAIYKNHQNSEKKEQEMRELAHDGNFTLPEKVPSLPPNAEAGQHWRIGVDPAAKGAIHHDSDLEMISEARNSSGSTDGSEADELWDEVASMVGCPTPKQSDYSFVGSERKLGVKRTGSHATYRGSLQRSMTGKMSVMSGASTDSWTSRYSCSTDGVRYDDGHDECDRLSLRYV